jgi:two-component system sporulation sensor kinase A
MSLDDASTELERRQSQADFLSLAETLSSLIALIEGDVLVYVNPAGCEMLGRPRDWYAGRAFWEVVHPEDREGAIARGRARQAGVAQPKRLVERLVHADGRTLWVDYSIDRIVLGGKTLTLVTGNDISERKRIEAELRQSEARLAEAQRIGHIGSWELDIEADRLCWSAELCRIYGVEPPGFGSTLEGYLELVHPDDREHALRHLRAALERGGTFAFEHRVVKPDGDVRLIFGRGEVFTDEHGRPVRVAGTGQDITERRRMEEELGHSEARFRNLLHQAPVMLVAFDGAGVVRDVSQFWLQTLGYEPDEVVGHEGTDFITPDSRERLQRAIEEGLRNDETVLRNLPLTAVRKDGSRVDLLSTSVAELDDAGQSRGAICVQINLTDLQRAEDALRESAERYRALVEHAPEAITVLDVDLDRFVDANAHAEKLFGYSREQLLTMGPLDFCTEHQADGRASCEMYEDENRRVLEGEEPVFEFTHVDSRGREIHCQTRLSRLPAVGRRLIRATTTDISELKRLEERMRRADRLAAAGALAAGVAHEIGNPLMALSMAAQSLERRTCDDYTSRKLALIREHSERISRIVRQMSELARPQAGARARCDVNDVVRRAVEMVRFDERARSSEIRYELDAALPEVDAVEDELSQVCINLALNAFDSMAANPADRPRRLTIRSWATEAGVHFAFRDTGPGVAHKVREKLFQPFVTTKEAGRGSGLGLSVSYRILEEHGGSLRLEPDDGGGAVFAFELPRPPHEARP